MTAVLIDGNRIAEQVLDDVARGVTQLKAERCVSPGLALVIVGGSPNHDEWARRKLRAATRVRMGAKCFRLPKDVSQQSLVAQLEELDNDSCYHGVFVQLPLSGHIDESVVSEAIAPEKDVDGMHPVSVGRVLLGLEDGFAPALCLAVREVLRRGNFSLRAKHIAVCSPSWSVASIMAKLLRSDVSEMVTINVCEASQPDLISITSQADILIAAIGKPLGIRAEMVKKGAVVIDTGQNMVRDATARLHYRIVGDVDSDSVAGEVSAITPVPGGIGPVTVAMLLQNTLEAARRLVSAGLSRHTTIPAASQ